MNHYETLGVAKTATPEELKAAYRKMAKTHHPDLGGDTAKFQQITEAYETLSDPQKRAFYDHHGSRPNPGQAHPGNPFENDFVFNHAFHDIFGDQFAHIFTHQTRQQPKNRNLRIIFEMDLLETLNDHNKVFDLRLSNGSDRIELGIPAGIRHDQVITVRGRGDNEFPNFPRGNLEIVIRVRPDDRFIRQDDNILTDVTIDCFDAILGVDLELDTPTEKRISMRVPAGTQNGTIFGITDEGFPTYPKSNRGKLLVRINVLVPKALTTEQILLVKEIQRSKPVNS
jgi:curved DNA-binding protein